MGKSKLITGIAVGTLFAGIGGGVIAYKAVKVHEAQDQMDDSNASMGGQLSFGPGHPLAGFAGTASADFNTKLGAKIGKDLAMSTDHKSYYVNLSDQIQGDMITGVTHSLPGNDLTKGDFQSGLDAFLRTGVLPQVKAGMVAQGLPEAQATALTNSANLVAKDHEINNLRASDVRRLLNHDLTDERMKQLGLTKEKATEIISDIKKASLVSISVGFEDIIEAASGGLTFQQLATPVMVGANPTFPGLEKLMAGLQAPAAPGQPNPVVAAALNAIGQVNGALSAIRRANPDAQIVVVSLAKYGVPAIDGLLGQVNAAYQMVALTQDIKDGIMRVAPISGDDDLDPTTTGDQSVKAIYGSKDHGTAGADAMNYEEVAKLFATMMAPKTP